MYIVCFTPVTNYRETSIPLMPVSIDFLCMWYCTRGAQKFFRFPITFYFSREKRKNFGRHEYGSKGQIVARDLQIFLRYFLDFS